VHAHAYTQAQCRRRGERQVTKYSRIDLSSILHSQGTRSPRCWCMSKPPPPWAARPPRPGLPAAPERGLRAPPGPEDGSDAPVTWAAGFLDTGGRRCRLRSATATPHVRQRGQHICQYSTNIITMRKRAVAQEYTASAQRSAETTTQRAQSEHTAVATATTIASTASAQRSQQCASGENDMHARVGQSAVLLLPVLCCEQRARSEPAASPQRAAASPQRAVFGQRC